MSGLEAMISKCEDFLGTRGRPNEATEWYADRNGRYFARAPWCNMFITWAAFHSGNYGEVCFGKDYAYTVWHAQRFKEAGQWHVDTEGIRRGDIVFFDWRGTNNIPNIDHIGIVTDVNGRDVLTIEGNTEDRCARRVRHADTIAGYGRPLYKGEELIPLYTVKAGDTLFAIGKAHEIAWEEIAALNGIRAPYTIYPGQELKMPESAGLPAPPPPPAPYTPPPFPEGLRPNSTSPSAKPLQKALKAAGYMSASVTLADNYGPKTQAAVAGFHQANPAFGAPDDVAIGPLGWAELHREAYGGASPSPSPEPDGGEPAHDYRRVTYGGKTVNVRTREMLETARELLTEYTWTPVLTQGSYNSGVAASAGTHDGGGVVDIRTSTMTDNGANLCVKALRKAGFAAWFRVPSEGFSKHIHAVAIGDRELSSSAKKQVVQYFAGTNGLANHGPDSAPASVGRPYPAWAAKYR